MFWGVREGVRGESYDILKMDRKRWVEFCVNGKKFEVFVGVRIWSLLEEDNN